jgi:hypothetical protein
LGDYAHGGAQRGFIDAMQESIECPVVRHGPQSEGAPEFPMFAQPHFGFPEGPVLMAHHAEERKELGLR